MCEASMSRVRYCEIDFARNNCWKISHDEQCKKSKVLVTAAAVISLLRSSVSNLHAFLQFAWDYFAY